MRELIRTRSVPIPAADRPRRLRRTAPLRSLVKETRLAPGQLVMPLFVISGRDRSEPIESLPGHARLSVDRAVARARELAQLGVGGVLLFGIPDRKKTMTAPAHMTRRDRCRPHCAHSKRPTCRWCSPPTSACANTRPTDIAA